MFSKCLTVLFPLLSISRLLVFIAHEPRSRMRRGEVGEKRQAWKSGFAACLVTLWYMLLKVPSQPLWCREGLVSWRRTGSAQPWCKCCKLLKLFIYLPNNNIMNHSWLRKSPMNTRCAVDPTLPMFCLWGLPLSSGVFFLGGSREVWGMVVQCGWNTQLSMKMFPPQVNQTWFAGCHRILLSFIFSIVHLEYPLSSKASVAGFFKASEKKKNN